jgi:hypothetical protein
MKLNYILDNVIELWNANDFIIKVLDLTNKFLDITLDLREDALHGRLNHNFIILVDVHLEVDFLFQHCPQEYLLLLRCIVGIIEIECFNGEEDVIQIDIVLLFEFQRN